MAFENSFLPKRHSFPRNFNSSSSTPYTWNLSRAAAKRHCSDSDADSREIVEETPAPAITSEGTQAEREARLEEALLWIRKELSDMRHQDKHLTRQFIQLRASIQRVKNENRLLTDIDGGLSVAHKERLCKDLTFRHSISGAIVPSSFHSSIL